MNEINILTIAINKAVKNGTFETAGEVVHIFQAIQKLAVLIQDKEQKSGSAQ